ncbi:hypothetical protein ACB092_03G200600 [Castanea dentata]
MVVNLVCQYPKMSLVQSQVRLRNGFLTSPPLSHLLSPSSSPSLPYNPDYQKQPSPSSLSGSKISPAILFIIVILDVIFFISDLLHLPIRFLTKHRSSSSINQAFIDALLVFLYKEIMGLKEPFDCALRLLPMFSHAFHIDCIGTWLLSNSTCPLCRGNLDTPGVVGLSIENSVFCFEDPREENGFSSNGASGFLSGQKPAENAIISEKSVFSVGLGKFRISNDGVGAVVERGVEETSSSSLDARCYSLGSYQYVVADSELQVALCPNRVGGSMRIVKGRGTKWDFHN